MNVRDEVLLFPYFFQAPIPTLSFYETFLHLLYYKFGVYDHDIHICLLNINYTARKKL